MSFTGYSCNLSIDRVQMLLLSPNPVKQLNLHFHGLIEQNKVTVHIESVICSGIFARLLHALATSPFRSHVLICMRPDRQAQLPKICLRPFLFLFLSLSVSLEMSLFPSILYHCRFSLYGDYAVRFSLPDGVFYILTTGWIFDKIERIHSTNQSIDVSVLTPKLSHKE